MRNGQRTKLLIVLYLFISMNVFSQQSEPQKYALVIGNGNYTSFGSLPNALNDAEDMAAALQELGFTVETIRNGNRVQIAEGIIRLRNRLSVSKNSYGFFYYAGHGVQHNGINYLIPSNADIPSANYLGDTSVSVQAMLAELNDAENELNIIVLDACRDFPAAWSRSMNRGLTVVSNQPADSIIVYATSAGSIAQDGTGRNGLFTSHLLTQLRTPGLSVTEVFNRTGSAVSQASNRQQIPAIYSQYFETAYLGASPLPAAITELPPAAEQRPQALPTQTPASSKKEIIPETRLNSLGVSIGSSFSAPILIGTVRGTFAFANNFFAELGFDLGLISNYENESYFSIYPYAHLNYFLPFGSNKKYGWYAGLGAGFMYSEYSFPEGSNEYISLTGDKLKQNVFTVNITTGLIILERINVSYTLRTNFKTVGNKLTVGYYWRF